MSAFDTLILAVISAIDKTSMVHSDCPGMCQEAEELQCKKVGFCYINS